MCVWCWVSLKDALAGCPQVSHISPDYENEVQMGLYIHDNAVYNDQALATVTCGYSGASKPANLPRDYVPWRHAYGGVIRAAVRNHHEPLDLARSTADDR